MKDVYKILVPTDFTSVAETALNHAIKIAGIMEGEIVLLHVGMRNRITNSIWWNRVS